MTSTKTVRVLVNLFHTCTSTVEGKCLTSNSGLPQARANSCNRIEYQALPSLLACLLRGYLTQQRLHCKRPDFLSDSHAEALRLLQVTI